jgi:hypothetical protein
MKITHAVIPFPWGQVAFLLSIAVIPSWIAMAGAPEQAG